MKQYFFPFLLTILILSISCNKEEDNMNGILEPSQVQRALVVETTGTWCSACPNGAQILMMAEYLYDWSLPVAVHVDDLETEVSAAFDANFPTSGVPNFYVGNTDVGQSPDGAIVAMGVETAVAGVGHEWEKVGESYNVTSRVKFYSADNGDFYVGCYFIHNPIGACGNLTQAGMNYIASDGCTTYETSSNMIDAYEDPPGSGNWIGVYLINEGDVYTHEHVIGGHAGANVWGESLGVSSVSSGGSYDFNFSVTPETNWTESGHILTVLWKKNGGTYEFVNGYME